MKTVINSHIHLQGTGTALITPFLKNYTIDYTGLDNLLQHNLRGKVDFFVLFGTTGESSNLTISEKKEIFTFVKNQVRKRVPIVYGLGGNNTLSIIQELKNTDFSGAEAILSVSPYYNKPSQSGLINHFKMLADVSPLPLILYNVPARTSSNMNAHTTVTLSAHPNIIAIKEASGDLSQCMAIIHNSNKKHFFLLSGDDLITLPLISCGAKGVISVLSNLKPTEFSTMVRLALNGNFIDAREILFSLLELNECMYAEGNPSGIKEALQQAGICKNFVRPPLAIVSSGLRNKIKSLI